MESSDYVLSMDASTNPNGLQVYVDGQSLASPIEFKSLAYGEYEVTVEVMRGPSEYVYDPITLRWNSVCDASQNASLNLLVSYVSTCARAEFYQTTFNTFAVTAQAFVISN